MSIKQALADAGNNDSNGSIPQMKSVEGNQLNDVWPELVPFRDPDPPKFPVDALPSVLRRWVTAESEFTQTPPDLAAMLALAVCSCCIARQSYIRLRDGWTEPSNIYVAVVMPPGSRKSAVHADAIRPLRESENQLIEESRSEIAVAQSKRRQAEKRLKQLEQLIGKESDGGKIERFRREAEGIATELAGTPAPVSPQLFVEGITDEKLGEMLKEQGFRLGVFSPEGGVFEMMAGRYSSTPVFDSYLAGHCEESSKTARIGRGSLYLDRPSLTCGFAVQPYVIQQITENAAFRGRGLTARFLFAVPTDNVGHRKSVTNPVAQEIQDQYNNLVVALARCNTESTLILSTSAHDLFVSWQDSIEQMLCDGELSQIREWGSKLAGATARIACILHRVVEYDSMPTIEIDLKTIEDSIKIASFLIPHADIALRELGAPETIRDRDANYVLTRMLDHGTPTIRFREIQRLCQSKISHKDYLNELLDGLVSRAYIREIDEQRSGGAGRPKGPLVEIRPALLESVAEIPVNQKPGSVNDFTCGDDEWEAA